MANRVTWDRGPVVVIGACFVDVKATSDAALIPATSNPGSTRLAAGGVGRNIAENLARLGTPVALVSAVGDDALAGLLVDSTDAAGVDTSAMLHLGGPTGTYTAMIDSDGELVAGVADAGVLGGLDAAAIAARAGLLASAGLIVLDANLNTDVALAALEIAAAADVPVFLEPVSVPKAARLAPLLHPVRPIAIATPNTDEIAALAGVTADDDVRVSVAALRDRGVDAVWLRLGPRGSMLFGADGTSIACPAFAARVVDVTGAGDAMAAAFIHAVRAGRDRGAALRFAHAAAALTIADTATVRPDLSVALIDALLTKEQP